MRAHSIDILSYGIQNLPPDFISLRNKTSNTKDDCNNTGKNTNENINERKMQYNIHATEITPVEKGCATEITPVEKEGTTTKLSGGYALQV